MSLINEALKKAQRQRTDATAPVIVSAPTPVSGGSPSPRIVKRRPPMPARTLVLLLVGGGLVLVTGGIVTFVLLNLESAPIVAVKSALGHRPPTPPPIIAPSVPTVTLPPVTPVPVAGGPPPAPAPIPVPIPVAVSIPVPVAQPIPEVIVPPKPPIVPARPPTPPKLAANPAVYTFLDTLRITGVRMSGGDSKVIMNDRIVRLNDYVDRALGLRLVKVTGSSLVFTDDNGFEYTKPL